jgi:hypothetical protein
MAMGIAHGQARDPTDWAAAVASSDWPYSTSVLAGTVDTRHIDGPLDDKQFIPVVHLVAKPPRPRGKGPNGLRRFNTPGLRDRKNAKTIRMQAIR